MASSDECIIKYHHEGKMKYVDGLVVEFTIDPDNICYWDLLGNLKELGYNLKKSLTLFFMDDG